MVTVIMMMVLLDRGSDGISPPVSVCFIQSLVPLSSDDNDFVSCFRARRSTLCHPLDYNYDAEA